jgi:hypothetical protein
MLTFIGSILNITNKTYIPILLIFLASSPLAFSDVSFQITENISKRSLPPLGQRHYITNPNTNKYSPLEIDSSVNSFDKKVPLKIFRDPTFNEHDTRVKDEKTKNTQLRHESSILKLKPIEIRGKYKNPSLPFQNIKPIVEKPLSAKQDVDLEMPQVSDGIPGF